MDRMLYPIMGEGYSQGLFDSDRTARHCEPSGAIQGCLAPASPDCFVAALLALTLSSPHVAHRGAIERFGNAVARGAAGIGRQRVGGKEAVPDDFAVRLRQTVLAEVAHDEDRDMVAPRHALVEEHAVQGGPPGEHDVALLEQLARQRLSERLACLHAAARQ